MSLSEFRFCHSLRVRWSETDAQGVVFNARYLDYGDIAITEYWRAVGFRFGEAESLEFHVARAEVDYKRPIKPDEKLNLWARTERIGNSSMTVLIEIHGAGDANTPHDSREDLRASLRLVQVHVDLATHTPLRVPDCVRDDFTAFDRRAEIFRT
jgi:acyl-CoA thioester hydrolase